MLEQPHPLQTSADFGRGEDVERIRSAILSAVRARAPKTICPSEVARALYEDEASWRAAMPAIRHAAAELMDTGAIRVTQKGGPVDPRTARGPIRLSLNEPLVAAADRRGEERVDAPGEAIVDESSDLPGGKVGMGQLRGD